MAQFGPLEVVGGPKKAGSAEAGDKLHFKEFKKPKFHGLTLLK